MNSIFSIFLELLFSYFKQKKYIINEISIDIAKMILANFNLKKDVRSTYAHEYWNFCFKLNSAHQKF